MHDFGNIDITGFHGILKDNRAKDLKTEKERTFIIESGPGCNPAPGTRRFVKGKWLADGMREEMNSHDFKQVIDPRTGTRTDTLPEPESDVEPVKLASEIEAQRTVRRKRGS